MRTSCAARSASESRRYSVRLCTSTRDSRDVSRKYSANLPRPDRIDRGHEPRRGVATPPFASRHKAQGGSDTRALATHSGASPDSKSQRTDISESSGTPSLENVIEWGVVEYV